ncbi:hypothetical protein HOD30_01245 [Candidatus Peregrinibacteria bacterium]|jgi:thioredoxin 1|nr:hypothetical protein [Candidatus Peregrinibacteria bacterium]MBT4632271.1 hypothetical protein [Candidatus Peregrinibacteria bacterium]MBT5516623.1 hypothetical protein [Candidatus Peregrinibacteria bacterium]MBT5824318.1 hypothetical protein [Candidatus Peregrinibacteria bacterium]
MKKILLTLTALLLFSACNTTTVQDPAETANNYQAAIAAEKDIFLDFYAPWCTICRANQPHIEDAITEEQNSNLVLIQIDYDSDTEMRARFDIFQQSMYVYIPNGNEEEARVIGPGIFKKDTFLEFIQGNLAD